LQILQNAKRAPFALGSAAQVLDISGVILVCAVGKVEAGDVHAEAEKIAHHGFGAARGTDGADDFRAASGSFSRKFRRRAGYL
jgi:hypothetical protein